MHGVTIHDDKGHGIRVADEALEKIEKDCCREFLGVHHEAKEPLVGERGKHIHRPSLTCPCDDWRLSFSSVCCTRLMIAAESCFIFPMNLCAAFLRFRDNGGG